MKNVLIIHTDQQRYDSLGCSGNRFARTPNIDRLAAQSTRFTRHVVSNPICSPSRASLLTGLYPPGHNVWCNGIPLNRHEYATFDEANQGCWGDSPLGFHTEPQTMADLFSAAGYDTASFGKLHLTPFIASEGFNFPEAESSWRDGKLDDWHGPYYGFRYVDLTYGHGEQPASVGHYANWLKSEHPEAVRSLYRNEPPPVPAIGDLYVSPLPFEMHHSAWLASRFCSYLDSERPREKPFFAFVGFPDPHHPFTPCHDIVKDFEDIDVPDPTDTDGEGVQNSIVTRMFQEKLDSSATPEDVRKMIRYTYAMVHQIDLAVGRMIDALEKAGVLEDTIIVFTSDHGDFLGDHGYLRKAYTASHALLNVPLILHAPGSGLPGQVDMPVSNCDVMPTVAALAGVGVPDGLDGADLAQALTDGREHNAFAFGANGDPAARNYTVYDHTHRMTWYPGADFVELFDHESDPAECRNVADLPENLKLVQEMKTRIAATLAQSYNPIQGRVCAW